MSRATLGEGRRRVLLAGALVVVLAAIGLAASQVLNSERFLVDDFVEYWAAGRLNLTGGNPFSLEEIMRLERAAGLRGDMPIPMWNPPWTLALVMPLSLLAYRTARLLWLLLQVGLLLAAATYIWWYYGGPLQRRWMAPLAVATYWPALWALRMGQINPLILVGVLGFLHFSHRRRWLLAGASASLVAVKPHLIYLFWFALLLWVADRRAWKAALGAVAALAMGTAVAWLTNHQVISQYITAVVNYPPREWTTPAVGGLLRAVLGFDRFWLQFVPPLIGALWFLWYWRRQRLTWRWAEQMPLLLAVSLATTPYGWEHDLVVLLLAVLQVAIWAVSRPRARVSLVLLTWYLACNGLSWGMIIARASAIWYPWLAPAFLVWYLVARRSLGQEQAAPGRPLAVPY